jgi:hypothetical protein
MFQYDVYFKNGSKLLIQEVFMLLEEYSQIKLLKEKKLELWDQIINMVYKKIYIKKIFKELLI